MDDSIRTEEYRRSGTVSQMGSDVAETLFRDLVHSANDAYLIFRIHGNEEISPFLEVNPAACRTTGYSREELLSMTFRDLVMNYTSQHQLQEIESSVFKQGYTTMEWTHVNRDGRILPVELGIRVVLDGLERIVFMVARDISERKEFESAMHRMAYFDDKTGLPNRRLFSDTVSDVLHHASKSDGTPAVVFLDLDNFKYVNNAFGHNIGDEVLVSAARRVRSCFPPNCTVARWGDDEFLALLPDGDFALQRELLVRMRTVLGQPFIVQGQHIFLSVSAGIAVFPADGRAPETLIRNASIAVSAAKRNGKNQVIHYTGALHNRVTERLQLAADLRRAISNEEFRLHFQPEMHAQTGLLAGMEALVRWRHPKRGLLYPDTFIAVAEEAGLIAPMGEAILRSACQQAVQWEHRGLNDYRMAVNLSVLQLQQPDFLKSVDKVLGETNVQPARLQFEITESVFMHVETVSDILSTLQGFGITIAIDDFGTGFSSLSYLRKLPIHLVKIDRSFIGNLLTSKNDFVIVKAILDLAHHLGLQVVAEGIETAEQEKVLQDLGCDFMQGYFYSRPVPPEEFEQRYI